MSYAPDEGRRRKKAALTLLEMHRERTLRSGRRALLLHLLKHGEATPDDVRAAVATPDGVDPVCFGAVPTPLAAKGIIRRLRFAESKRPDAHARPVSVWGLVDAADAIRWLQTHPELPAMFTAEQLTLFDSAETKKRPTAATNGRDAESSPVKERTQDNG